jgi:hypothetical protein
MLAFAAKPRILRIRDGHTITIPSEVTLTLTLSPPWLFGAGVEGSQFVVGGSTGVSIFFNANNGRWHLSGGTQPPPLRASCDDINGLQIRINGNVASATFWATTVEDIVGNADWLLYGLPAMLNTQLQHPCVVERLVGKTPQGEFGYEVVDIKFHVDIVTEQGQNELAADALRLLSFLDENDHRRLLAGLIYFYRATRLLASGNTRWEFMAEAVLNLTKSLESIFPPAGDGKTRGAVRRGLVGLGFSTDEIETWFLPALALRDSFDVAHVKLAILSRDQIETLTLYVESAVKHFRRLFQLVAQSARVNRSSVPPYVPDQTDTASLRVITQIADRLKAAVPGAP